MKPILHYSRERLKHHRFQVFDFFVPVVPHILDIHLQSTTLFQSVLAIETTAANCHDSKLLLVLLDKADIQLGIRIHADKAYSSQKQRNALKSRGIKNGIQDKAAKNNPLTHRQLQRNSLITKARYVVERTFGSADMLVQCQSATLPRQSLSACLASATGYGV